MGKLYSGLNTFMLLSREQYDNLESYDINTLYFIEDTNQIYKGTTNYNTNVSFVSETPSNPIIGRLYFNTTTAEITVYDGTDWYTANSGLGSATRSSTVLINNIPTNNVVNGVAVSEYVDDMLDIGKADTITDFKMYEEIQIPMDIVDGVKMCTFTKRIDNSTNLGVRVDYEVTNDGVLSISDSFIPSDYNDYINSLELLTDIGILLLSKV